MLAVKHHIDNSHLDMAYQFEINADTYLDFRLSLHDVIEAASPVYAIGSVVTGTKGNFTVVSAPPKAGKSTVIAALASCVLCGQVGPLKSELDGHILYVDTEQGKEHCQSILRRIRTTSGVLDYDLENRLFFMPLREKCPEDRFKLIEQAIYDRASIGLEVVIIDGIRDLVYDINDQKECAVIINKLLEWTAKFGIHIICVLHENKGNGQLRGHLGSEAQNKAETVMRVEKIASNACKVEVKYARNKEFPTFIVTIADDGELLVTLDGGKDREKPIEFDEQVIKNVAQGVFKEMPAYASKNALKVAIQKHYFDCTSKTIGDLKVRKMVDHMELAGLIEITKINAQKMEIRAKSAPLL